MSARISAVAFAVLLFLPSMLSAQLTNGKKPQLPAPFATKSSGNPPEDTTPPQVFCPRSRKAFA
jgi:hypothetical protein